MSSRLRMYMAGGVVERLVVPGRRAALAQRAGDEEPLALAGPDALADVGEVEAAVELGAQRARPPPRTRAHR